MESVEIYVNRQGKEYCRKTSLDKNKNKKNEYEREKERYQQGRGSVLLHCREPSQKICVAEKGSLKNKLFQTIYSGDFNRHSVGNIYCTSAKDLYIYVYLACL
jgi:hypothetical protein